MTWGFAALGLSPDADARAIKRAYAARLKTVRPDEDPEGFQRLNEAYQAALQHCAARDDARAPRLPAPLPGVPEADASPVASPPDATPPPRRPRRLPPPPIPEPVAPAPEDASFDIAHCLRLAANWDHQPLIAWLDAQASLWSLDGKARCGRALLLTMTHERPPVADHNFETLAKCFGYYDLHTGHDFIAVRTLRDELHALWREARSNGQQQETQAWNAGDVAELSGASTWREGWRPSALPGTQQDWSRLKFDPARKPRPHKEGTFGLWLLGTIILLLMLSRLMDGRH
ncbi:MAG: J domain-containing protein [Lysobacteraceae bacterium]